MEEVAPDRVALDLPDHRQVAAAALHHEVDEDVGPRLGVEDVAHLLAVDGDGGGLHAAPGGDTGTYLQQKANQLGLTGTKNSSTSFGGTSWQQIQGNVLLKGASYTETLVTTTHKNSMYTIMLLAPQTTYEQEDQIVFSKMFASFQFLA